LKQVEADLGPIEVLVNNADITHDATLHRMKAEQWTAVSPVRKPSRAVMSGAEGNHMIRIGLSGAILPIAAEF
jgi:NAD(P)-dependent dehydrogenase (short-subunit alcohol dehydrogenase family)